MGLHIGYKCKCQQNLVSTPGGDELGYIHRRSDGLWNVTSERDDSVQLSAITKTQTDAKCYLATLPTNRVFQSAAASGLKGRPVSWCSPSDTGTSW